jgi:hypothetical protein
MDTGKVSFHPKRVPCLPETEIPPFNWKGTFSVPILSIRIRPQAFSLSYALIPATPPTPPSPFSKPNGRHTERPRNINNLLTGEWGGDRGGAKSENGETVWSSINNSILSGVPPTARDSYSPKWFLLYLFIGN